MCMYEVKAKCGHVGRENFVYKTFAVMAESKKEAALKVRNMPRVKHHKKDAIAYVYEISVERYKEIQQINNNDPYFFCSCVQDQRRYEEVNIEKEPVAELKEKETNKKTMFYGKERVRNQKKYFTKFVYEVA